MKRVIVAIDVDDDLTTEDVAFALEWDGFGNATVWTPEEFGTTLIDRDVADEGDGKLIDEVRAASLCDGCSPVMAGVRWPTASNRDNRRSWVERCDCCQRFDSDDEAAAALAVSLGVKVEHDEINGRRTPYVEVRS